MYQSKNVKLNTDKTTKEKRKKENINKPKVKMSSSKNPFLFFFNKSQYETKDLKKYQRKNVKLNTR